ncbi:MAG: transketolase C-terminal domain-containing protein [Candidatus Bathyarchaeia archaeon]
MVEEKIDFITGNDAVAYAVKLARVQVVAAYPITPQSPVTEKLSEYVANGEMDAEYIKVEGEHSCLAAMRGAGVCGVRIFTATCGPGLMYAHENLECVHRDRTPLVIAVPNRSYSSLFPDYTDSMCEATTGFIQLFVEDAQEALDTTLQGFRIAEDHRVLMPLMVLYDGYVTSHTGATVRLPSQEDVDRFLPPFKPYVVRLDPSRSEYIQWERPGVPLQEMEHEQAMTNAKTVIKEANDEYAKIFGRSYGDGLVEEYRCEDADVALVTMASMTGTARQVVDTLREKGQDVGLLRLRSFRPFPAESFQELQKRYGFKAMGVCERDVTHGCNYGEVYGDLKAAFYDLDERPKLINFIFGLGGSDIRIPDLTIAFEKVLETARTGKVEKSTWFGYEIGALDARLMAF